MVVYDLKDTLLVNNRHFIVYIEYLAYVSLANKLGVTDDNYFVY
jgi:hypothetical protein